MSSLKSQDNLAVVTTTFLIKNATVVVSPGNEKNHTSILLRDGIIFSNGQDLIAPYDAEIIEADSMYVYSGFIATLTHAGTLESIDLTGLYVMPGIIDATVYYSILFHYLFRNGYLSWVY